MPRESCQFLHVGRLAPDPRWRMAGHSHPHHELITVIAGRMTARMNDHLYTAAAGQCLWYPPGVVHEEQGDPANPVETYYVVFRWNGADRRWPQQFADAQGRIATLARWLLVERDAHTRIRQSLAQAFLRAVLAEFRRLCTAPAAPTLPERIRAHMRAHLAEALTLDDLAGCAAMSKYHFARRYRVLTGLTPMEDLRQLRLEAARDLLLTTDLPLKAIAPRTGLGDEYHLSRLFRRAFGLAPGALRRQR